MAAFHRRPRSKKPAQMRLPVPKDTLFEVGITHHDLNGYGYGVISHEGQSHPVKVLGALGGEQVRLRPSEMRKPFIIAELSAVIKAAEIRQTPPCPDYAQCGGCQLQHLDEAAYQALKTEKLAKALNRAGFEAEALTGFYSANKHARRRARIGLRRTAKGPVVGFRGRASHQLIRPSDCVVLAPELNALWPVLEEITEILLPKGGQAEAHLNLLSNGVDMLITADAFDKQALTDLPDIAKKAGLVRLSLSENGEEAIPLYAPAQASLRFEAIEVSPPAGSFLQASATAEALLQDKVGQAVAGASQIADLYCGVGTLSLPLLAKGCFILGSDSAKPALDAFKRAANKAGRGNQLKLLPRDLMKAPVLGDELAGIEAVILDPPRAGAAAQIEVICTAQIPVVAMVSCHLGSFMRDAAALKEAGYHLDWVALVDQFHYAGHIELVARFSLPPEVS